MSNLEAAKELVINLLSIDETDAAQYVEENLIGHFPSSEDAVQYLMGLFIEGYNIDEVVAQYLSLDKFWNDARHDYILEQADNGWFLIRHS